MASTSVAGIACAARIAASAASLIALGGTAPPGGLDVGVEGLRSAAGNVQVCLTADPGHFPDCQGDPAARRLTVPAAEAARLHFADLPSGAYAIALFHDENGNARLDTRFGIPREGFGFSRNPSILFGPPRFKAAEFSVGAGAIGETVKVRYLL